MMEADGTVNLRCGICSGWMTSPGRLHHYQAWRLKYQKRQRSGAQRGNDDGNYGDGSSGGKETAEEEDDEEPDVDGWWNGAETSFFHGLLEGDHYSASSAIALDMTDLVQQKIELYTGEAGDSEDWRFFANRVERDFAVMDTDGGSDLTSGVICTHAACLELYVGTTLYDEQERQPTEARVRERGSRQGEPMREEGLDTKEEEKQIEQKKQTTLRRLFLYLSKYWGSYISEYLEEAVIGVEAYRDRIYHSSENDYGNFYVEAYPAAYYQWGTVPKMNALELRHLLHRQGGRPGIMQNRTLVDGTQRKKVQKTDIAASSSPSSSSPSSLEMLLVNMADISVVILTYLNYFEQEAFSLCSSSCFRSLLEPALQKWYKMKVDNDNIVFVPPSWSLSWDSAKIVEEIGQLDPDLHIRANSDPSVIDPLLFHNPTTEVKAASSTMTSEREEMHHHQSVSVEKKAEDEVTAIQAGHPPLNWRQFLYRSACSPSWRNRLRIILCSRQLNEAIGHSGRSDDPEDDDSADEHDGSTFRSQYVRENDFLSRYLNLTAEGMQSWDERSLKFIEGLTAP